MKITEHQAIVQLENLITALGIELPKSWDPFKDKEHDLLVVTWLEHPDNEWCSGKKEDFQMLMPKDYEIGNFAETALLVFGIRVYR